MELFGNLSKEFNRLSMGLSSSLDLRSNITESVKKNNKRLMTNCIQFTINSLNVLNHVGIKQKFSIEKLDAKASETLFKALDSIMRSTKRYMEEVLHNRLADHFSNKEEFDSSNDEGETLMDESLYHKLFMNAGLFLWTFSAYDSTNAVIINYVN